MDDVIEINGFDNACRLCLTTEQTRSSIFDVQDTVLAIPFAEKIHSCLSIQVLSSDNLSTVICITCIKNINQWYSFKNTCLKSQEKLQQWLITKQNIVFQPLKTIKEEAVDVDFTEQNLSNGAKEKNVINKHNEKNYVNNIFSPVSNTNNMEVNQTITTFSTNVVRNVMAQVFLDQVKSKENGKNFFDLKQIKSEPLDTEDEDNCNVDIESVNSGELLINPMAVANTSNSDRIMEADSTQKLNIRRFGTKKKIRRGPHTHFRGLRLFKKKCIHCKINLHSKHSYMQHMSKYHGIIKSLTQNDTVTPSQPQSPVLKQKSKLLYHSENIDAVDVQNEINPDDSEFENMIKGDPLTVVQKSIIGQLKTFSCFTCKQTFSDRRETLNHIRTHMPDLRPFTCIACLTEFSDKSTYTLHCRASFECTMKIALVVPQVGNEKYFTCNMCLRQFNNRQELLNHLPVHDKKQYKLLTQPGTSLPKLKAAATNLINSRLDPIPNKKVNSILFGPYMGGDPAYNFMCDLCGMIYKRKPNMFKHRELCSTLSENIRTSYKCFHCNKTYLVFKKFYTHVLNDHKIHAITCFTCQAVFENVDDYRTHHETHRVLSNKGYVIGQENGETVDSNFSFDLMNKSNLPVEIGDKTFNCALCGENFMTKVELSEHRNLHLKVKIYSCVICRSMFSSSRSLEIHMKEHGIEDSGEQNGNNSCVDYDHRDPLQNNSNDSSLCSKSDSGGRFNHCYECNKNFSNLANLKRHERNMHIKQRRRWSCQQCKRRFKSPESYEEHVSIEHGSQQGQCVQVDKTLMPGQSQVVPMILKPMMQCPKCPKTFTYQGNLILHCQNVHKENHFERAKASASRQRGPITEGYSCDLCGKTFREEQSLKTHRGWHLRSNYKLKVDKINVSLDEESKRNSGYPIPKMTSPKPAKARKSFPNNPFQKQLRAIVSLQCQVCDDRFTDVAELRKHLWDVHCARNKPEKNFTSELQCELCTNKFSDEESLETHIKWHSENPILSNNISTIDNTPRIKVCKKTFHCEICGKYYSNRKVYLRHKKLHKVLPAASMMNLQSLQTKRPFCSSCHKSFSTDASLKRHKASPCHVIASRPQASVKKITTTAMVHHPPAEPMQAVKREPDIEYSTTNQASHTTKKKPVHCLICKAMFPSMSVLYQHKQLVHKIALSKDKSFNQLSNECVPLISAEGLVCCNLCGRQFPGISNLKQHFSHKHKIKPATFPCFATGCKLVFSSASSLKSHESTHSSIMYSCHLCDRHVFSKAAITKHMLTMHKALYQSGTNKNNLWSEVDLTTYNVKNCQSTACPKCKIKYPNLRALKIHYLKFHEKS